MTRIRLDKKKLKEVLNVPEPESESSYIVYARNGVIYAKNGRTGQIEFSGTDASAVIQSAIDALPNGGKIFIKAGTYAITSTLTLNAFIKLVGEGRGVTRLQGAVNPLIQWTGKDHVEVRDLTLDGVNKSGDGIKVLGTWGVASSGFNVIENLQIINVSTGIVLRTFLESVIRNVRISESVNGVMFLDSCINDFISGLDIVNLTGWGIFIGSITQRCEGLTFDKSLILNAAGCLYIVDGIFLTFDEVIFDYGAKTDFVNIGGGSIILFDKCYFASPGRTDGRVRIWPSERDISKITFQNSIFTLNRYYGLTLNDDPASGRRPVDIEILGCRFVDNGLAADGGDILIVNADRVRIVDSELLSTTPPYNLAELGSPTDIYLIRNTFAKGPAGQLLVPGANIFHKNKGYVTENSGTATITAGNTYVDVTHGLAITPDINRIKVLPKDNLGGRSFWVSDVTSTTFRINISSADTVDHSFGWSYE